jgi:hypothetical protein
LHALSSRTNHLAASIALFLVLAACGGLVFKYVWDRRDPGIDPSLNGKTSDQLVQELGEPESSEETAFASLRDQQARAELARLDGTGEPDPRRRVLVLAWYRTRDDLPALLRTSVWFRWADGRWAAFHNYRGYLWAGL